MARMDRGVVDVTDGILEAILTEIGRRPAGGRLQGWRAVLARRGYVLGARPDTVRFPRTTVRGDLALAAVEFEDLAGRPCSWVLGVVRERGGRWRVRGGAGGSGRGHGREPWPASAGGDGRDSCAWAGACTASRRGSSAWPMPPGRRSRTWSRAAPRCRSRPGPRGALSGSSSSTPGARSWPPSPGRPAHAPDACGRPRPRRSGAAPSAGGGGPIRFPRAMGQVLAAGVKRPGPEPPQPTGRRLRRGAAAARALAGASPGVVVAEASQALASPVQPRPSCAPRQARELMSRNYGRSIRRRA